MFLNFKNVFVFLSLMATEILPIINPSDENSLYSFELQDFFHKFTTIASKPICKMSYTACSFLRKLSRFSIFFKYMYILINLYG